MEVSGIYFDLRYKTRFRLLLLLLVVVVVVVVVAVLYLYTTSRLQFVGRNSEFGPDIVSNSLTYSNMPHIICGNLCPTSSPPLQQLRCQTLAWPSNCCFKSYKE